MDWLNYHHLLYFWTVAKEGGISKAPRNCIWLSPRLSSQIKKLETSIGAKLFDRSGRSLVLTDTGQMVFRFADEIFTLGRELTDALKGRPSENRLKLTVGVPDVLPKLVVYELLEPALEMDETVHLECYEGKLQDLLAELALHRLDIVLADSPLTPDSNVRAFNHLLGECGVTVYGAKRIAKKYRKDFPQSLDDAPMLLPTHNTTLRRHLEKWFDDTKVSPRAMHEFEDSAVLKVFGQAGHGLFVTPTAIEDHVVSQYDVEVVGHVEEVRERFYAISVERRLKHPAVVAISEAARTELFG